MKLSWFSWRTKIVVGTLLAITVSLIGAILAAGIWTEYSWYKSLGQQSVFTTRLVLQSFVWVAFSVLAFPLLYVSARLTQRLPNSTVLQGRVVLVGSISLAVLTGWTMSQSWATLRLAIDHVPFGIAEPQFGADVGLYVFVLPALTVLQTWFGGLVAIVVLLVPVVLLLSTVSGLGEDQQPSLSQYKPLLSFLTGFVLLAIAFDYWLNIWRLDLSTSTQLVGASYADVHSRLPAYWLLAGIAIIVAFVFFATARSRNWVAPLVSSAVWVVAAVALGLMWPALQQNYVVSPNEAGLELPYIERNIEMTRAAWDLSSVRLSDYPASEHLGTTAAARADATLAATRVWTPSSVDQAFDQLQTIRPYYALSDIDSDRYIVDGDLTSVLVAAREMDSSLLPETARTWVNQHLVYTHGYGLAMAASARTTPLGFPEFLVGGVPPKISTADPENSPDLETTQPRIYFGTASDEYVIVNTGIDEFDYPVGQKNAYCRYEEDSGIPLGSFVERVAWAIRFGSEDLLFSEYLNSDSRILMYRDVRSSAERLAPWLDFEEQPYPALVDGRVTWILDGCTSSNDFPYSQSVDGSNYLRNSVKVTVDALTGDMHFYANGEDPIRDSWARIFGTLITPDDEVPPELAAHFRYPRRLFSAQTSVYRAYHMTDPSVFYNKEDQWQVSGESTDNPVRPAYMLLDAPGEPQSKGFFLVQPYAPSNRDNLIAIMAAGCDSNEYGEHTAYLMPKERVVLGPEQVSARINQDPRISPQLSLWDQRGSNVKLGQMVIAPVEGAIAYVQPIFLQADESGISELAAVVVVVGDRVEMDDTLGGALDKAFGVDQAADTTDYALVDSLLDDAVAAKSLGDPAGYDAILHELDSAIRRAESLASSESVH